MPPSDPCHGYLEYLFFEERDSLSTKACLFTRISLADDLRQSEN